MSYILDALRKAQRDHQVSRVPTLATAHGGADLRRASWVWPVAGGVLALGALVTFAFLWVAVRPGRQDPVAEVKPPVTSGAVASRSDPRAPAPPLAPGPERTPSAAPDVTGPPAQGPTNAQTSAARVALPAPAKSPPPAARVAHDVRSGTGRAGGSAPSESKPKTAAVAPPTSSLPVDRDTTREPEPAREALAPPAVAAVPPSDGGGARAAPTPAPAQALPRLTLDVLVYSDVPAERLVFINGRKYVEGQAVDGETVVEQITSDGATLRYQGKPVVLRPKLNPYARPGSP